MSEPRMHVEWLCSMVEKWKADWRAIPHEQRPSWPVYLAAQVAVLLRPALYSSTAQEHE